MKRSQKNPDQPDQPDQTDFWKSVCSLSELEQKVRIVFRAGKSQIVVFISNQQTYAIDNRCPHEGYPLSQGELNSEQCTLTCQWHNWKFDLQSGEATVGQDSVRTYASRIQDGQVWVDLSPPRLAEQELQLMRSVKTAFEKRQYGRMARELARFHYLGLDPERALQQIIIWSYERLEFGMGHAYAAAADWVQLSRQLSDPLDQLSALNEAIDHIAQDSLRQPIFAYSADTLNGPESHFLDAIENEEQQTALAWLNGALNNPAISLAQLERVFAEAALAHYNDFGHSLIYQVKSFELIALLGEPVLKPLLISLTRSLIYATREDLLPEFKSYAPALAQFNEQLVSGWGSDTHPPDFKSLQGASVKQSLEWVRQQAASHTPLAIYQALLGANAHNLLYFDSAFQAATENAISDNIGWLDFTHALTFANAVRISCQKHPELWPQGLLQLAAFYGRNTAYLDLNQDFDFESEAALNLDWEAIQTQLLDHGLGLPIFSAHLTKTALAIASESESLLSSVEDTRQSRRLLNLSLQRFLAAPIKQRHLRRVMKQSLELVSKDF